MAIQAAVTDTRAGHPTTLRRVALGGEKGSDQGSVVGQDFRNGPSMKIAATGSVFRYVDTRRAYTPPPTPKVDQKAAIQDASL